MGVTVLPRSVAEEDGPPIAVVDLDGPALGRTVALVWPAGGQPSRAAAASVDFARREGTPGWRSPNVG